jgi:hypothetical protein
MRIELEGESEYEDYSDAGEEVPRGAVSRRPLFSFFTLPPNVWARLQRWGSVIGNVAWMITTSVILVGLPVLYAYDREKNYEAYEAEQQRFKDAPSSNPPSASSK